MEPLITTNDCFLLFTLITYCAVMITIAVKYQAGFLVHPEERKAIPEQFMNVVLLGLFSAIILIPIITSIFSDYVHQTNAHDLFFGCFMGMMIMNFIHQQRNKPTP